MRLLWQGKSACGETASMDQGSTATSPQGREFGGNHDLEGTINMWVARILPYNAAIQCTKRSEFFWIHSPGWMSDCGTLGGCQPDHNILVSFAGWMSDCATLGGCPPDHNILVSRFTTHIHHATFIHPCSDASISYLQAARENRRRIWMVRTI